MKKYFLVILCTYCLASTVSASQYNGTFDPDNAGFNKAYLVNNGGINNISREITVGKFTTQTNQNGTISNNVLTGWMWGAATGWISFNCSNVPNSCNSSDYKVTVNNEGYLSGYAWGPQAGWVNFAPTGAGANTVRITPNGDFVGYAWSQVFGYISFNCSNDNSCGTTNFKTYTDFRPVNYRSISSVTPSFLQKITNVLKEDNQDSKKSNLKTKDKKNNNIREEKVSRGNENNTNSNIEIPSSEPSISNFTPTSKPPEITKPLENKELNKDVSTTENQNEQVNNAKKKLIPRIIDFIRSIFEKLGL